jgi:hypothetical protein
MAAIRGMPARSATLAVSSACLSCGKAARFRKRVPQPIPRSKRPAHPAARQHAPPRSKATPSPCAPRLNARRPDDLRAAARTSRTPSRRTIACAPRARAGRLLLIPHPSSLMPCAPRRGGCHELRWHQVCRFKVCRRRGAFAKRLVLAGADGRLRCP